MSRQTPFMRSTNDRYCNNCQNGCQNDCPNNCNNQQSCCDDCDDCHDKDKNPCVICPPGPVGPQGPQSPQGLFFVYCSANFVERKHKEKCNTDLRPCCIFLR